jgi:hypothetical protein
MRPALAAACLTLGLCVQPARAAVETLQPIRVSGNGRYFVQADGKPFFWLGDTAWSIFNHPKPEEVDAYLDDRAAKGFTVIQGCLILWDGLRVPNPDGQLPFIGGDPARINEAFFKNVDSIIAKAEARGLRMGILPMWTKSYGANPRFADTLGNPEKMRGYARFLGERYGRHPIFWILGGDTPGRDIRPLIEAMAAGLREGAGDSKMMITYHPTGRQSSSFWFQDAPWLDFNSMQSGHRIATTNFEMVADDYAKTPVKPTLDMEPGYENITNNLVRDNPNAPRIQAVDVRRAAYLAVFAGAAGHTYGNGEVYEFWSPESGRPLTGWSAHMPWRQALQLPASSQVQNLRWLVESRPMLERMPDPSLIVGENSPRAVERFAAMRGSDGSYAFVYIPSGKRAVTVRTGILSGATTKAWWYDPRTGAATGFAVFPKAETHEFKIPSESDDDWVLVLDDASRNYGPPGRRP